MARTALLLLATLLPVSLAQNDTVNVWSAVSFILYGERTPLVNGNSALTPVGAQQMYEQGSVFRARYIGANSTSTPDENAITTSAPIVGLQRNAIDNSQLTILTTTDAYTAASALAFMQGLYPPMNQSFAPGAGGLESAVLADGTMVNFPLDGYQYAVMETATTQSPDMVWVAGNVGCSEWFSSAEQSQGSAAEEQIYNQTLALYQTVWQQLLSNVFSFEEANWNNAYEIYDYVSYHYEHDAQFRDKLDQLGPGYLSLLREYASTQQRDLTGNLTVSGLTNGDMIRAVSGRTFATQVVSQFQESIAWGDGDFKLNLMVGSYEPFVAFFALSGLVNGASAADFEQLPYPGAAMTFELFSVGGNATVMPANDDLMVRFLYRNSTDPGVPFLEYPLFGNSPSKTSMAFAEFVSAMEIIGVEVADWCTMCNSPDLFCAALTDNQSAPSNSTHGTQSGLSPAIAGVIGAISALVFMALAAVFAALLGGLRLVRRDSEGRDSTLGGFRGAEKMASDPDLAYSKGGARHERTGSWELRNGGKDAPAGDGAGLVSASPPVEQSRDRVQSTIINSKRDDDAISIIGHTAVSPVESV